MKYDARHNPSQEDRAAFISWLTNETASTFQRASGVPEGLKGFVFLAVNRAHEAGLSPSESAGIIGTSVARAGLSSSQEEWIYDCLELFGPIVGATHAKPKADMK